MKSLIILLCLMIILTSCKGNDEKQREQSYGQKQEINNKETSKMRREFCVVKRIDEQEMVLINTKEEVYRIDASFLEPYEENDKVLLLCTERTAVGENEYTAEVYAIYPDDDKLLEPELIDEMK